MTEQPYKLSNNHTRVFTGLAILPVVIFSVWQGEWWLFTLVLIITILGLLEFYALAADQPYQANSWIGLPAAGAFVGAFHLGYGSLAFVALLCVSIIFLILYQIQNHSFKNTLLTILMTGFGILYLALSGGALLQIRQMTPDGIIWVFAIFLATGANDTFAYYGGRFFGKRPLAPKLSPKKTIEGALVGIGMSWLLAGIFLAAVNLLTLQTIFLLFFAPFFAIAGDLFESALKRRFNKKDSAIQGFNIFPGHGGVLDRIDAMLWVTLWFYVFLNLVGV